ncbi:centrosomal protein of 112 kDa-like [Lineus longissimus]|uniref:centrosomal protein of 112 kDa-like n=1 Tax=Lineus longissimus TaxID=88925 RepID=UPI002B4E3415
MHWPFGSDPEKKREELRTKRANRISENETTLRDIKKRYKKAEDTLNTFQEKWNNVDQSIDELEREKNDYDYQIEQCGEADHGDQMEVEQTPTTKERLYLEDLTTLRKHEAAKDNMTIQLKHAKDINEEAERKYHFALESTTESVIEARREKTAAFSALFDLQANIQMVEYNTKTVKDRIEEYEIENRVQGQKPTASRKLLIQLKEENEQKITTARSDRTKLYKDLEDAKKEENAIRKEKEDFESIVKQMEQMDNDQHASVTVCVQEGLLDSQFNTLKDNYIIKGTIPRNKLHDLTTFSKLWIVLESKGYISVGDYQQLRKDLQKMSLKTLASAVEKLEDELLKEYETGRVALTQLHDAKYDTHTKLLNKRFETVYPNAKQYDTPGEPCRFYRACLTVICDFQNNLDDKSESSKGVHKFLKEKLDRREISVAAEKHVSEYYSMKNKVANAELQLGNAKAGTHDKEKEMKTLKTTHEKEIKKLKDDLKNMGDSWRKDNDKFEKIHKKMQKKLNDHEKDSSGLQQELTAANNRMECLLAEKRNSDEKFQEFQKLQAKIMEDLGREEEARIEEVESFKDKIRNDEISAVRQKMKAMEEKHKKELDEERQKVDKDMKAMEEIFEDYEKALIESRTSAMATETKLRGELNGKLLALEKDYGEDMVEWDEERMELKKQLLEANIMQAIASQRMSDMETKIRRLEFKLEQANERIEILLNGIEEQSD